MKPSKRVIFGLVTVLLSLTANSSNKEFTWKEITKKNEVTGKRFKIWSKIIISEGAAPNQEMYHSYHYDPEKNQLFTCSASGNFSQCHLMDSANSYEHFYKSIEQKNGWKYVGILMLGPSYYLYGPNPFAQWNDFSFYLSKNGPQYCQRTATSYNFTYNKEGKYLAFKSDKHDESDLICGQMQWK